MNSLSLSSSSSSSFSLSFFSFLLLSLLFTQALSFHNHTLCGHDHNDTHSHFSPLDIEEEQDLDQSAYPALRITVDSSLLEDGPIKEYLTKELFPPVIDYFQAALKLKRPLKSALRVSPEVLQNNSCKISSSQILIDGADTDFVLVLTTSHEMEFHTVGTSYICYRSISGRPVVAKMKFNAENCPLPNGDPLVHERNTYLAIHEMIHSLGFGKSSFKHYINENGQKRQNHFREVTMKNGEKRNILDLEPLTERLRRHIGCDSIPGVLLENDGGNGTKDSHFERRMFLHEVMTSGMLNGHRVSEFSLAALEGSGWYLPDYSFAEPFHYGQGQGCEFWHGPELANNTSTAEYCSEEEYNEGARGCAPTGRSGGKCIRDPKTEGYNYYKPLLIYDCENPAAEKNARFKGLEVFGREAGSKCFSGTLASLNNQNAKKTSFCFTYQCKGTGLDTLLEVAIGDHKAICKEEGPIKVDGFSGELMCPDPLLYCNTIGKQYCPRNCMGRGECMENNQCKCKPGYGGVDCSIDLGLSLMSELVNELKEGF